MQSAQDLFSDRQPYRLEIERGDEFRRSKHLRLCDWVRRWGT